MAAHATVCADVGALVPYLPAVQARWLVEDPLPRHRTMPGTLVFADVSGFTPLTEKLAARGKVGAEELTEILNEVDDRLLSVAEAHGGDLLKFGGDALLLLFEGDGHERRGAAAAHGMQVALRPFRRLRTGGGPASLRMSVGVSSGDVVLFHVGGSSRWNRRPTPARCCCPRRRLQRCRPDRSVLSALERPSWPPRRPRPGATSGRSGRPRRWRPASARCSASTS